MNDLLEKLSSVRFHAHTPLEWAIGLGICLGAAIFFRLVRGVLTSHVRRVAERTTTRLDDAWVRVLEATAWYFYLALGLVAARFYLDLTPRHESYVHKGIFILVAIQVTAWIQTGVTSFLELWAQREGTAQASTASAAIRFVVRLILWTVLLLVILGNLGVELTTLVAGLGVGGVAAALAVQKVLGDLISGLSMYFDRPFDIGDFVIVGDIKGNVTKIGLRTTRIDSISGEKVVYPNGELVTKCILNYQRMAERRIVFQFGIEYGLSADKVELARDIAKSVVEEQANVRFDRAHFFKFGASSLDFEVVYFVLSRDYNEYMDVQQAINMSLYRRFEEAEIPFAFPTSTLHHRGLEALVKTS